MPYGNSSSIIFLTFFCFCKNNVVNSARINLIIILILFSFYLLPTGQKIIVRTEEVCIVGFVLILWVGAIALFFNRWGKIRMLEPYQPKFQQQHRSSCPLVDMDSLKSHPVIKKNEKILNPFSPSHSILFFISFQRPSVSRMSMGMAVPIQMPPCQFTPYSTSLYTKGKCFFLLILYTFLSIVCILIDFTCLEGISALLINYII